MKLFARFMLAGLCALVCSVLVPGEANATNLAPLMSWQCSDNNGDPVSGCKAKFFEAGTSTPLTLYGDQARSVDPFTEATADSAGRFDDTYCDPAVPLKITYTTSADVTIKTYDNVDCPLGASETSDSVAALGLDGSAASASLGTSGDVLCKLNASCVISAQWEFQAGILMTSTSDAATAAPLLELYRNPATASVDDVMGEICFTGEDDGSGKVDAYACIDAVIADETDTTEDGALRVSTMVGGTQTVITSSGAFDSSDDSLLGLALLQNSHKYYYSVSGSQYAAQRCTPIETQSASTSASLDFETVPTGTTLYILTWEDIVVATDDVDLWLRQKFGGSFLSGASDYAWFLTTGQTSDQDNADSEISMADQSAGEGLGNAAGEFASGFAIIRNPLGTSLAKKTEFRNNWSDPDGATMRNSTGVGQFIGTGSTGAFQGIRLMASSGNLTSGTGRSYACFD